MTVKVEAGQSDIIARLLVVQQHDTRIRALEREARDIPTRKKEEEARLTGHKKAQDSAEGVIREKLAAIKELEVEGESRREKVAKLRRQQMEIKTNREFKAIEDEIKAVAHEISGIEDSELVLMEETDAARAEVGRRKKALTDEGAAVASDIKVLDGRLGQIEAELSQLRAVRQEAAVGIDAAMLRSYETIFDRKAPAIVPLEDGVCGGCHMQLAPYMVHDARKKGAVVACSFCGRILYGV
jgi:predicted  nucleic acid-binding Zn-ribbon protein